MKLTDDLANLPGAEIVQRGLAELADGQRTVPACLVATASERMRASGLLVKSVAVPWENPERELYALLLADGGDAYSRYNALRREFDSFLAALARRVT